MAEDHAKPTGPDLVEGIALSDLADGGKLLGHCGDEPVLLVRRGAEIFAIGRHAHITAGRSSTDLWWKTPFGVHGITRVLICGQARPCAPLLSVHSLAGRWNNATIG